MLLEQLGNPFKKVLLEYPSVAPHCLQAKTYIPSCDIQGLLGSNPCLVLLPHLSTSSQALIKHLLFCKAPTLYLCFAVPTA